MHPDAHLVLQSLASRLGRQPTLVELLQELQVQPSGTPSPWPENRPPTGVLPSPAEDPVLTLVLQTQDLIRMERGTRRWRSDQFPFDLRHSPEPGGGSNSPIPIRQNGILSTSGL